MKTMIIGNSGIQTSVVSTGSIEYGSQGSPVSEPKHVVEILQTCLENGINYIDTAAVYGVGASETLLGEAIKVIGRQNVVLQTKCGLNWRNTEGDFEYTREGKDVYRNLSPQSLRQDLEDSLRRLQTEYIDIYMTHRQQPSMPLEESIAELVKMKQEGKIRAIGASNLTPQEMEVYCQHGLDIIQQRYSLLDQDAKQTHFPLCEKYHVTFQGWGMLEHGVLSGKVPQVELSASRDKSAPVSIMQAWKAEEVVPYIAALLEKWTLYQEKYNCSFVNLVQACTLRQFDNMNLLIGQKSIKHIADTAKSVDIEIAQADYQQMMMDIDEVRSHELPNVIKPFR
ncbi:aldo/keto reductase [Eubacteriales bacterium OttesenSCG-928-N14]|nr:aldo/keto reductase [Eubacteriales bacterium OttesenSCG-928-N14]